MRKPTSEVLAARAAMAAFVGPDKPERKPRRRIGKSLEGMRQEVAAAAARVEAGDWEGATPATVVALYAYLHEVVYGVAPEELAEVWMGAVSAARRLLEEPPFDGDVKKLVGFVRFTWSTERRLEAKTKGTGNVRRRIGWRLQFVSRALVVDYKRAMLSKR